MCYTPEKDMEYKQVTIEPLPNDNKWDYYLLVKKNGFNEIFYSDTENGKMKGRKRTEFGETRELTEQELSDIYPLVKDKLKEFTR